MILHTIRTLIWAAEPHLNIVDIFLIPMLYALAVLWTLAAPADLNLLKLWRVSCWMEGGRKS